MDTFEFPEEYHNADFTMDAESNGLLDQKCTYSKSKGLVIQPPADRIWMICHKDQKTGNCVDFIDDEIFKVQKRAIARFNKKEGRQGTKVYPMSALPQFWEITGTIFAHNGMKFDFPLVEKLLKYHLPRERRWDTLLQSQTQNCDRKYVKGSESGPHSVESWAIRLGKGLKVEHEDWMNFSLDMYRRCYRDVEIQCDILTALNEERENDRLDYNIDWTRALHTEHMAAFWIAYSEQWGFTLDTKYARSCVTDLDNRLAEIEDTLLPQMPFRINFDKAGTKVNFEKYCESMLKNTTLSQIPLGWCWAEDASNKPTPIWKPFKKDGNYTSHVIKFWATAYEDDAGLTQPPIVKMTHDDVAGPFTRIRWVDYNLGSNDQVVEYLVRYTKWEATEFTETGNPSLTEDSYDSIGVEGVGELLKEYLIRKSRRTNIENFKDPSKGWLNHVRDDGRVTPINHTMGTPTARSRHANIVNVPSGGALFGEEMRKCWTAYEGGQLVGADASGLEFRALAHEMDDEQCTREIVDGDIHTVIWELISDISASRGNTKSVEYALIYGGSDAKLGELADVPNCREHFASEEKLYKRGWKVVDGEWRHTRWHPKKESVTFKKAQDSVIGGIIRSRIMKGLQPLGDCIDRITKQSEKGYLVGLDGRKLIVRSSHSALNLKLQSNGAIICKTALVNVMERAEKLGLVKIGNEYEPFKYLELSTFYHDEYQISTNGADIKDTKVLNFDLSDFDLSDKKQKKLAGKRIEGSVKRFQRREHKSKNIRWSGAKVDLKAGTATMTHSEIGQICVEEFERTTELFDFKCDITGEYMTGNNWLDTH